MTHGGEVPNMDLLHRCYRAGPAALHRYVVFFKNILLLTTTAQSALTDSLCVYSHSF